MEMETLLSSKIKVLEKDNFNTEILTDEALVFLESLHLEFNSRRIALMNERPKRQLEIDKGVMPYFLPETKSIRDGDWKVAPIPHDLQDRRVEITGPVSRKMIINALNSGAKTFMADFEDSNAPTWMNVIDGQQNLKDAVDGSISFHKQGSCKIYTLNEKTAVLIVRPRAWHLDERHLEVDGEVMSAALVDFGLYFFHNVKALLRKGTAAYFYLPKMESHLEARLWNDVFVFSQKYMDVPQQTIRATVLIETIMAAFEMDEILYELKDHIAGLNCGRWDYIFSFIKRLRMHREFLLSDRDLVGMSSPFMNNYSLLLIQTCHKRGASAIGGMAAQIPIKEDEKANRQALDKVVQDKMREVKNGHDGTWVAHPALVSVAQNVFDAMMPAKNQIEVLRSDVNIQVKDLLEVPKLEISEAGLRKNINVGILYMNAWPMGSGAAALYHLMEDAATAEISRAQIWQWIKHGAVLNDGRKVDKEFVQNLLSQEVNEIKDYVGKVYYENARFPEAIKLFEELIYVDEFEEFLTLKAYPNI